MSNGGETGKNTKEHKAEPLLVYIILFCLGEMCVLWRLLEVSGQPQVFWSP